MPADPARAADLDATGLALALEDGATSAEAVLEVLLDRIARHDGRLRAFVALDGERARAAARGADRARRAGHAVSPLHGVAVAVKDIIDVAGQPTGLGSPGGGGRGRARESATVVEAAIAAGMVAVGKTHTVEYAFGGWGLDPLGGAPWNPWDAAVHRVPGGSSGGSAVAVAAGLVAVAIGTDTVGSIRVPASFAGVVGLRTTTTAVDRRGVLALAPSLDTVGPLVRSVRDAELMLALLAGAGTGDLRAILAKARATAAPGLAGLRIAVPGEGEREGVAAEVLARFDDSVRALARRGATVAVAAGLPASAALAGVTRTILRAEAHAAHHGVAGDPASGLGAAVRAKLLAGAAIGARDYLAALA
ncbi:MAG: amidase, partial [Rhodobacteraceae bacterium]|nr:amidase [Paracoccaceae bacterium]